MKVGVCVPIDQSMIADDGFGSSELMKMCGRYVRTEVFLFLARPRSVRGRAERDHDGSSGQVRDVGTAPGASVPGVRSTE